MRSEVERKRERNEAHTQVPERMVDYTIRNVFITSKEKVNNLAKSWVRRLVTQHPYITF